MTDKDPLIIASLVFILSMSGAYCQPPNEWNPALAAANQRLKPWFEGVKKRIARQDEFQNLIKDIGTPIYYSFKLERNGAVTDVRLESTSNRDQTEEQVSRQAALNEAALHLVVKSAPFEIPPNELPYQGRIVIKFTNSLGPIPGDPEVSLAPKGWGLYRWN